MARFQYSDPNATRSSNSCIQRGRSWWLAGLLRVGMFIFQLCLSLTVIYALWQVEFPFYANTDLLIVFQCDHEVSYR
jgi:hypothetical protein